MLLSVASLAVALVPVLQLHHSFLHYSTSLEYFTLLEKVIHFGRKGLQWLSIVVTGNQ